MTTDTEFETWVRSQLQEIAEGVTARPDPYGRLLRRRRNGWLRIGLFTGVAAVAVSGGVVAVVPTGSPEPTPPPKHSFEGVLRWEASIIDAAARGTVGADQAFVADLEARIEQRSREGDDPMFEDTNGRPLDEVDARVAFAEDIDDSRIVAITLQRVALTSPYQRYGVARLLWLAGPHGASAEELAGVDVASPGAFEYAISDVYPFTTMEFSRRGRVWVGLAPPECEVSTAPSENLTAWQTEPTRSWVVRTSDQYRPEYWRVTCGGVVREEWPVWRPAITPADITTAMAGAPGVIRRDQVEAVLQTMSGQYRSELLAVPRVLWSGPVSHDEAFRSVITQYDPGRPDQPAHMYNPEITLVAAPAARGGWIGYLHIDVDPDPDYTTIVGSNPAFAVADEPGTPGTVLGLKIRGWSNMVFVLAPEGATRVRLLAPDGTVVDEATVTQPALLLSLPRDWPSGADDARVEAIDATGTAIASADLGTTGDVPSHYISDWR